MNEEVEDSDDWSSTDQEWKPKLWKQYATEDKFVSLNLPAKSIPSLLSSVSTISKTSVRQELKLTATLLKEGGADLSKTSQSVSTVHRQRKLSVKEEAKKIRKKLQYDSEEFLVAHWDSKIIQVMSGKTQDRLAICISIPNKNSGQFIASPEIPSGSGQDMADAAFIKLQESNLIENIRAIVFDTTASNSGKWKGSVAVFEKLVARSLLWLACRHHISELHIKHANEAVRGPSKGPDDKLFKSFREVFEKIVLNDRALWNWPNEGDWRKEKASNVLEWATINMEKGTWIREDYRELLELVVIYLGGVTKRLRKDGPVVADVEIRRPGAIHQARFMSSCIYILKISLFMHQSRLKLKENEEAEVKTLAEFIVLVYAQYFLQTPLAIKAPGLDRDLWNDMHAYQACYPKGSMEQSIFLAVKESILRHLWYLTEELFVFGLFDNELSINERRKMANKLIVSPWPRIFTVGKPNFPIDKMTDSPSLESFVGERSWSIFQKLSANGEWLDLPVEEWENNEEFQRIKSTLSDLKVVNDPAELCIKDIQEYCKLSLDPIYREEILVVATDHRGIYQDLRKQSLDRI